MSHLGGSVCKINYSGVSLTGSMIQVELDNSETMVPFLLTCKHGIRTIDASDLSQLHIDFQGANTKFTAKDLCADNHKLIFISHDKLDQNMDIFAIRLSKSVFLPDDIKLIEPKKAIAKNEEILVLHHPKGDKLKISSGTVEEIRMVNKVKELRYTAWTEEGYGAPVVDKRGRLVGIHQRDVSVTNGKEKQMEISKQESKGEDIVMRGEGIGIEYVITELATAFKGINKSLYNRIQLVIVHVQVDVICTLYN